MPTTQPSVNQRHINRVKPETLTQERAVPVVVETYEAPGDLFYVRAFVRVLAQYRHTLVLTAYPEFFRGIHNTGCLRISPRKEGGIQSVRGTEEGEWDAEPSTYDLLQLTREEFLKSDRTFLEELFIPWGLGGELQPGVFDATDMIDRRPRKTNDAILVVEPVIYKDWPAPARNPARAAFVRVLERFRAYSKLACLKRVGYGNVVDGDYDKYYDEIVTAPDSIEATMRMMLRARAVITPVCFALPMALALRVPVFAVYGGHVSNRYVVDWRMVSGIYEHIEPHTPCNCYDAKCPKCCDDANKTISNQVIDASVKRFRDLVGMTATIKREPARDVVPISKKSQRVGEYNIAVPSGIGDVYWALTKVPAILRAAGREKTVITIQGTKYDRAGAFVERFDFVDRVEYDPFPIHPQSCVVNIDGVYNYLPTRERWRQFDWFLLPNATLESGGTLDDWLPEYKTDWNVIDQYKLSLGELALPGRIRDATDGDYAIFYLGPEIGNSSDYAGHNRDELWSLGDWRDLAQQLIGHGLAIVLVGGKNDTTYADLFVKLNSGFGDSVVNMVGKTSIGQAFAICRGAQCLFGYPSGIPIVSACMGVRTGMWMRQHGDSISPHEYVSFHDDMCRNTVNPVMVERGTFLPMHYRLWTPARILDHIEKEGWF